MQKSITFTAAEVSKALYFYAQANGLISESIENIKLTHERSGNTILSYSVINENQYDKN